MSRRLFALWVFASGLACGRPPSTTPLGGTEWLPPEPHSDRRATSASTPIERPAQASTPAPSALPSASSSSASPPKAPVAVAPGELRFGWEPLTRGATVVVDTHYAIHALLSTSFQGRSTEQKLEANAHERIEVKVTEVSGDELRELELAYVESKSAFSMGDTTSDGAGDESNAGKRYRVSYDRGTPRVRALSGSSTADQDKGVLFDLATVVGFVPLARPHLPANLLPGWKAKLDARQVTAMFGELDSVKLEGAWLTLRGREAQSDTALFDCGLPVRLARDGLTFTVELKGTCTARARDSRPLEVSLRGPLRAEVNAAVSAATTITGSLEATITHSYPR